MYLRIRILVYITVCMNKCTKMHEKNYSIWPILPHESIVFQLFGHPWKVLKKPFTIDSCPQSVSI